MLAVTGATGEIGHRIAVRLAASGLNQRLIVRDPSRAPALIDAEVFQVSSFGDPRAMSNALAGVDTLFLVSAREALSLLRPSEGNSVPLPYYDRVHQHIAAVSAAVATGVRHIVYLSFLNAQVDATFSLAREHFQTEEFIRSTGVAFTFLRQGLYMDNVPALVTKDYAIRAPAGEGRASWVSRDDIADVAAAVLTGSGHEGKTYDVTGPEALSLGETAERLSSVIGRKITYQPQTPHEARVSRNMSRMEEQELLRRKSTGKGISESELEVWISHYLQIATGEAGAVSDWVPRLTGHAAQTLAAYLDKHPESYRHLL